MATWESTKTVTTIEMHGGTFVPDPPLTPANETPEIRELLDSGAHDTLGPLGHAASRLFLVQLADETKDDPICVLRRQIEIGDEHPRAPGLRVSAFEVVDRPSVNHCRVQVWYAEPGRKPPPPPVAPENETTTGDGIYRPWSWEACMIVAMAAIAPICALAVWGILKWVM